MMPFFLLSCLSCFRAVYLERKDGLHNDRRLLALAAWTK